LTIRNSNLRTKLPALRLRVAFVEFHAHCVCVVGKNYRLQDIQLSKIIRGSAPNPGSVARGSLPAPLPRRRAVRALLPENFKELASTYRRPAIT
jgi:hypothetical protein